MESIQQAMANMGPEAEPMSSQGYNRTKTIAIDLEELCFAIDPEALGLAMGNQQRKWAATNLSVAMGEETYLWFPECSPKLTPLLGPMLLPSK